MNYSALIQNRRSVREFTEKEVSAAEREIIRFYYQNFLSPLIPHLSTALRIYGPEAREALEGAAGYNRFLVGAPQYLVLTSEKGELAALNGGYIMEKLILKLTEMNFESCWLTFTSSEAVKTALGIETEQEVMAIAAFGHGKRTTRRLRLNIESMSNITVEAQRRYMEPKRGVSELAYLGSWGNTEGLEEHIGFYEEMLWESLYAASLAPSYLNRQAYAFVLHEGKISLVRRPDELTPEHSAQLSLGAVLQHFGSVAEGWTGKLNWQLGEAAAGLELPEGHSVVATAVV